MVLNPCVSFQVTFHHSNIADGQILQPILILPVKGCFLAMHNLEVLQSLNLNVSRDRTPILSPKKCPTTSQI